MTWPVSVVQSWLDAVNRHDSERLLEVSAPTIVIVGPRGRAVGHAVLRDWLARAGLVLTTQRVFQRGDTVVVAQQGRWRSDATQGVVSEAALASRFRVAKEQVVEFERFDDLATALTSGGLSEADEYLAPSGATLQRIDMHDVLEPARDDDYCYLTTIGRVSGLPREIEIWFAVHGHTLYMLAGNHASDWVKNLRKTPQVTLRLRNQSLVGTARVVEDTTEDALARRLVVAKYQPRDADDLGEWGRNALPVAVDFAR
jgi:deazaflavin-dependent oxidoreductase (nitroreductase family)